MDPLICRLEELRQVEVGKHEHTRRLSDRFGEFEFELVV
jgi:hypothetical protein